MAYAKITFENKLTGETKEAPVGYSWTTLFFGPCPALLREHLGMGVFISILTGITWGASNIVFSFIYNKLYIQNIIRCGFKATSSTTSALPPTSSLEQLEKELNIKIPKNKEVLKNTTKKSTPKKNKK